MVLIKKDLMVVLADDHIQVLFSKYLYFSVVYQAPCHPLLVYPLATSASQGDLIS